MKEFKKLVSSILCVAMILTTVSPSFALDEETIQSMTPRQSESYENHLEGNATNEILKIESSTIKIQTEESTLNLLDSENKVKETEEESEEDEIKNPEDIEEPEEDEIKRPEDIEEPEEGEIEKLEDVEEPEEDGIVEKYAKLEELKEEKLEENESDNKKCEEDESEKENIDNVENIEFDKNKIESIENTNKEESENVNNENIDKVNEETSIISNNNNEDDKNIGTENTDNKELIKNDNNTDNLKTNLENEEKLNIATDSDTDFDNEKADIIENENNGNIFNTIIATSNDTDATENGVSDKINNELLQEIKTNVATSSGVDNVIKDNIVIATSSEVNVATDSNIDLIASDSEIGLLGSDGFFYGYIDHGIRIDGTRNKNNDGLFGGATEETFDSEYNPIKYPEKYKNEYGLSIIPPAKYQGKFGTCVAFASIGSMETSIRKKGLAKTDDEADLSEAALAYFYKRGLKDITNSKEYIDKPGLEGHDYNSFSLERGAQELEYTLGASLGLGILKESDIPYTLKNDDYVGENLERVYNNGVDEESKKLAFNGAFKVKDVEYIRHNDISAIKKAILKNGSVGISFRYNANGQNYHDNQCYYLSPRNGGGTAHAVIIIGWDDNISKEKFWRDGINDESTDLFWEKLKNSTGYNNGNGAWLVKNSWAISDSNDIDMYHYFWLSYNDPSLGGIAWSIEMSKDSLYKYNYHYDTTASTRLQEVGDCTQKVNGISEHVHISVANVYKVTGSNQVLEAINVPNITEGLTYNIQVYTKDIKMENPIDGIARLGDTGQEVYQEIAGIHNVELNEKISLKEGTYFSVVITSQDSMRIFYDITNYSFEGEYNEVERGQSYICIDNIGDIWKNVIHDVCIDDIDNIWKDASYDNCSVAFNHIELQKIDGKDYGASFRIRALTNDAVSIKLEADNGRGDEDFQYGKEGDIIKLSKNIFKRPAHKFVCWVDENGKEYDEEEEITVVDGKVFKAKWEKVGYVLNNNWHEGIKNIYNITNIKISVAPDPIPTNVNETKEIEGSNGLIVYRKNTDLTIYGSEQAKIYLSQDASYLFAGITSNYKLKFLSLNNIEGFDYLDTSRTTDMSNMFYGTINLKTLDLSGFDTKNVENMEGMFCWCQSLTTIMVSDKFIIDKVTDSNNMFSYCYELKGGNKTTYSGSHIDKEYAHIDGKDGKPGYFTEKYYVLSPGWYNENVAKVGKSKVYAIKILQFPETEPKNYDAMWEIPNSYGLKCYFKNSTQPVVTIYAPKNLPIYTDENSSYLFSDSGGINKAFNGLDYIDGLNKLNTKKTTNMSHMFEYAQNLYRFDLSNFDTSEVTDMSYMFYEVRHYCHRADLHSFNTSKVKDMSYMFWLARNLESIDLSNFDMSSVVNMSHMFEYCERLTTVDLSSFNTSNVTNMNMSYMFNGCEELTNLRINIDTSKASDMSYMFSNCKELTSIDLRSFNTSNVQDMSYMFNGCKKLETIDLSSFNRSNVTDMNILYMFKGCEKLTNIKFNIDTSKVSNMKELFYCCKNLTTLDLSNIDTSNVTNMSYMFYGCSNLTTLDLSNFNTSKVENMNGMFMQCNKLKNLNLSSFNISIVEYMNAMFYGCSSLTDPDLSNFNTSSVVDMSCMFMNCSKLKNLDLSGFNTYYVESMAWMFRNCSEIEELDISSFSSNSITETSCMFYECSKLRTIKTNQDFDFSHLYSKNVFYNCKSLVGGNGTRWSSTHIDTSHAVVDDDGMPGYFTAIYLNSPDKYVLSPNWLQQEYYYIKESVTKIIISKAITQIPEKYYARWKIPNSNGLTCYLAGKEVIIYAPKNLPIYTAENSIGLFSDYSKLKCIEGLEYLKTEQTTNMSEMFFRCRSLETLDLSSFHTSNVTNMSRMFISCNSLTKIIVSEKFTTDKVTNSSHMFCDCANLEGGKGTKCGANIYDATYARIDKGTTRPGYFTEAKAQYYVLSPNWWAKVRNLSYKKTINLSYNRLCGFVSNYDLREEQEDITNITISKFPTSLPTEYYSQHGGTIEEDDIADSNGLKVYKIGTELIIYAPEDLPIYTAEDSSYLFSSKDSTYEFFKLQSISGLEHLNTSRTTNMSYMFSGCSSLTYLDLSNFDVSKVTNTSHMYLNCEILSTVKVNNDNSNLFPRTLS